MSSIMEQIKPEHPELFALEFGKTSISKYEPISTKLVKMYVIIRSPMSSIMDLIGAELPELFAFEFANIAESDFVYTLACTNVDQ